MLDVQRRLGAVMGASALPLLAQLALSPSVAIGWFKGHRVYNGDSP